MAPGFEFKDFELAERDPLLKRYPSAEQEILRLT
jgi:predicted cupin superfamily sugar epimerase